MVETNNMSNKPEVDLESDQYCDSSPISGSLIELMDERNP